MKIIVPLKSKTWLELKSKLAKITAEVDIIEIWLDEIFVDFMRQPQVLDEVTTTLQQMKQSLGLEVLAVCKTRLENGKFGGNYQQRFEILSLFLKLGGDLVDFDVTQNPKETLRQIPSEKLWCSLHDFKGIPEDLEAQARTMRTIGPAMYKFAVTPQSELELEQFIQFAETFTAQNQAIFTTMGEYGVMGREKLKNITWGGFYALDESEVTASGQPTLSALSKTQNS